MITAPARAADVVERSVATIATNHAHDVEMFGPVVQEITDALLTPDTGALAHPAWWPRRALGQIRADCQDMALVRRWRKHRIIYTLDSDLAAELALTDPDGKIPGGLVRQLPHPDPFLVLPEPIKTVTDDGNASWIVGALIYATTREDYLASTADTSAASISLMLVGEIRDDQGRRQFCDDGTPDYTWSRVTLPPGGCTVREAEAAVRKSWAASVITTRGTARAEEVIGLAIERIVPMVLYLCAANAERRTAPAVATKKLVDGSPRKGKAPRVIEHGYFLGPKLAAARRRAERPAASAPTGRHMRPHIRRAHWHTFLTGPGRTVPVLQWLPPIPVHPDQDTEKSTVIPVAAMEG